MGDVNFSPASRIVVVGIGNLIRTDDGLGVHALERLRRDPRVPAGVTFIDGGTYGIELLAHIFDSTHLLLLDAIDAGEAPGILIRMENEELRGLPCAASVHQVGLADLLATLPLVSTTPRETVLLGVVPASTVWGTSLTPEVEAALADLVDGAVRQLQEWTELQNAPSALKPSSPGERSSEHAPPYTYKGGGH
jgi:hydrogenase maturation protease